MIYPDERARTVTALDCCRFISERQERTQLLSRDRGWQVVRRDKVGGRWRIHEWVEGRLIYPRGSEKQFEAVNSGQFIWERKQ